MRNECVQMPLFGTYKSICASVKEDKPKLFRLLGEHIDWDLLAPARFYTAFYQSIGRLRKYPLAAFPKGLVLQKISGYVNGSVLLVTLHRSQFGGKAAAYQWAFLLCAKNGAVEQRPGDRAPYRFLRCRFQKSTLSA